MSFQIDGEVPLSLSGDGRADKKDGCSLTELCTRCRRWRMKARPQQTPAGLSVTGKMWGISKAQIRDLLSECRQREELLENDDVRTFVERCVKPRTQGTGMGMSLLLNQDKPLEVTVMISHAWDEHAGRFFEDIEEHVKEEEVLFICFLAIYQNEDGAGPSISEQLGGIITQGPFADVITNLRPRWISWGPRPHFRSPPKGRMLVITNLEAALYTRMWCIWEVYIAKRSKVPIQYTSRGVLFESRDASSRHARCGRPDAPLNSDERGIRRVIESLPLLDRCEKSVVIIITCVMIVLCILLNIATHNACAWVYSTACAPTVCITIYMRSCGSRRGDPYDRIDRAVRDGFPDPGLVQDGPASDTLNF